MTTKTAHFERLVTLLDGRQVSSWSEEWRHECEARTILAMPSLRQRRAFLYGETEHVRAPGGKWVEKRTVRGIEQTRGKDEVRRLEATMTAIWKAQRAARRGAA